jgi:hypothetical protein
VVAAAEREAPDGLWQLIRSLIEEVLVDSIVDRGGNS